MKLTVTVGPREIVSRGRAICRLANCSHAGFWRRAPAGTWQVRSVSGSRTADGFAYTLTLERSDPPQTDHLADFSVLDGFEIVEAEKRRRAPAEDPGGPTDVTS